MGSRVRFIAGDARKVKLEDAPFAHVFSNPPFHPGTGQVRQMLRATAPRATWTCCAHMARRRSCTVKPDGTVTAILRADRLDDFLEVSGRAGVSVLPLLPALGEKPKRVIVQLSKGDRAALFTAPGFALHEDGRPTHGAEAILRHAASLPLTRS